MRNVASGLAALGLLALGGCSTPSDPWLTQQSYAADAQAGVQSVLRAHSNHAVSGEGDEAVCAPGVAPVLEVVQQGTLGAASIRSGSLVVADPDGPCDGVSAPATEIVYDAAAGAAGIDTVVYREFRGGAGPDRIHTATVRVR
jgi:hypothetical protein